MRNAIATACLFVLIVNLSLAENWPQWRGPRGNGVSLEKGVPVRWSSDENVTWKVSMPAWSGSTPVVWGDRLFLTTAEGGKRQPPRSRRGGTAASSQGEEAKADPRAGDLSLWCLDRNSGEVLWKRSLGGNNQQHMKQNMSSPSPVTDGKRVWAMTGTGIVKAFDWQGTQLWSRNIQEEYGTFGLMWGYASSPLLDDGTLYVQVLHGMRTDDPSYLLAIDALSGKNRWRVERGTDAVAESPDAYTTPVLLDHDGRRAIVVTGGDYVTGHDPETGAELWRAGGLNPKKAGNYRIVASTVILEDILFVSSRKDPLQAIQVSGRQPRQLWATEDGPDVPTPVTDGERLYVLRDNGVVQCLDVRTGEVVWGPERIRPGTYSSSPLLADGHIYMTSEDGVTTVIEAGPEFRLVTENEVEGYTLSSLAVSEGQMFLRTEKYLYCIGDRHSGS